MNNDILTEKNKLYELGSNRFSKVFNESGLSQYLNEKFDIKELKNPTKAEIPTINIPDSRLHSILLRDIYHQLGKDICSVEKGDRVRHTIGQSYKDLIRIRSFNLDHAPDIVFFPENEDQITQIFKVCHDHHIALIPYGVCANMIETVEVTSKKWPYLACINLTKINSIQSIDDNSLTATVQAGKFGLELEKELNQSGYTIGYFPNSFKFLTLGAWIASRSTCLNSHYYDEIDKIIISLKVLTPSGVIQTLEIPSNTCGLDLRHIFFGNEDKLGIIFSAKIKIHKLPEESLYFMHSFSNFETAVEACKDIAKANLLPSLIRIYNEAETDLGINISINGRAANDKDKTPAQPIALVLIQLEGNKEKNNLNRNYIDKILKNYGGTPVEEKLEIIWREGLLSIPKLNNYFVENDLFIETYKATSCWNNIDNIYKNINISIMKLCKNDQSLTEILTNITYFYPKCVSVQFTIITKQRKNNLMEQWSDFQAAINQTLAKISNSPNSIDNPVQTQSNNLSHDLIKQIKKNLDPKGILNPELIKI